MIKRSLAAHNPFLTSKAEAVLAIPRIWGGKAKVVQGSRDLGAGCFGLLALSILMSKIYCCLLNKQSHWCFKSPVQTDNQEEGVIFQP